MENLKNIRLIIFDLDGTLVDSGADITNALNYAIEPFDRPRLSVRDTISLVGEGITSLIDKVMINSDASTKKSAMDRFIKYYSEHLTEHTRPYPGVRETLEKLVRHKKAVISNKRESLSKKLLEELGLLAYFDVVLGSDSVNEKKPSPVPVIKVMSMLDAKPEETVIAGDSDFDIKAGKEAGISTVGVTYGFRSRESLRDADFLIDKIDELLRLTGGNAPERRKETRYPVPELYREYIAFRIKTGAGNFVRADLLDFSRHGLKLRAPFRMDEDSVFECLISIPASLSKEIAFKIKIRYSAPDDSSGESVAGAKITEIADELWFIVFEKVLNFIKDRMGRVF